jgi:hypothetical protein
MKSWTICCIAGSLFLILLVGFSTDSRGQEGADVLASRIIDQEVCGEKDKTIGEVDDIIIRRSGNAKKLTVEFGEWFWDLGDKLVALPFKKLSVENGKLFLDVTEQELKQRPYFYYHREGLRPGYYYRTRPYGGMYPMGFYQGPGRRNPPVEKWAFSASRFLGSVILDRRLINERGVNIGWVKDLLINLNSNKVEKIIVSPEDISGKGDYVALPYKPLGFTAYGLVYDVRRDQLENMPKYSYPK